MQTHNQASAAKTYSGTCITAMLLREQITIDRLAHDKLLDRLSPREAQAVLRAAADKLEELI